MTRLVGWVLLVLGLIAALGAGAAVVYTYVQPPTSAAQLLYLSDSLRAVGFIGLGSLLVVGLTVGVVGKVTGSKTGMMAWSRPWYVRVWPVLAALAFLDLILTGSPGVWLRAGHWVVGHGRSSPPTEIPLGAATAYLWHDARGYADLVVFVASLWVQSCVVLVMSVQRKRSGVDNA